jgi:chorismate-pyruvate lyase
MRMNSGDDSDALAPLFRFYRMREAELPRFEVIQSEALPEPHRALLAHRSDMTTRLEAYHNEEISLCVRHEIKSDDTYDREVVLLTKRSKRPVEYGAIEISLAILPDEIQTGILAGNRPLGGILVDCGVVFESQPKVFFAVSPCPMITEALQLDADARLYGRVNRLAFRQSGKAFAHVVEILPP